MECEGDSAKNYCNEDKDDDNTLKTLNKVKNTKINASGYNPKVTGKHLQHHCIEYKQMHGCVLLHELYFYNIALQQQTRVITSTKLLQFAISDITRASHVHTHVTKMIIFTFPLLRQFSKCTSGASVILKATWPSTERKHITIHTSFYFLQCKQWGLLLTLSLALTECKITNLLIKGLTFKYALTLQYIPWNQHRVEALWEARLAGTFGSVHPIIPLEEKKKTLKDIDKHGFHWFLSSFLAPSFGEKQHKEQLAEINSTSLSTLSACG